MTADSGYESTSTTATISRGHSSASELSHQKPQSNPPAVKSPLAKPTPIDSVAMCLDQLTAMNHITLQVCVCVINS